VIDFARALQTLAQARVEFIVVGGAAATAHGAGRVTQDLNIVYARDPENLERLAAALIPFGPYPRGARAGLPFQWDARTLQMGLDFTLETRLGDLNLLGEIVGGGGYAALLPHTMELEVFGIACRCLDLEKLIAVKRAAGRPKDFEAIAELEAILEERESSG